jgi:hypothetical protein
MGCIVEKEKISEELQDLLMDLGVVQSLGNDTYLTIYGTVIVVKETKK